MSTCRFNAFMMLKLLPYPYPWHHQKPHKFRRPVATPWATTTPSMVFRATYIHTSCKGSKLDAQRSQRVTLANCPIWFHSSTQVTSLRENIYIMASRVAQYWDMVHLWIIPVRTVGTNLMARGRTQPCTELQTCCRNDHHDRRAPYEQNLHLSQHPHLHAFVVDHLRGKGLSLNNCRLTDCLYLDCPTISIYLRQASSMFWAVMK